MSDDRAARLFERANGTQPPTNEEETIMSELHAALGFASVPTRLRSFSPPARRRQIPMWLYAAAAVVIGVLGVAGYLALDPASGVPTRDAPTVVMGLASQSASCDLTGDVPIFSGVDHSPIDVPSILVKTSGELVLVCNGAETPLASNVVSAMGTQAPHVLIALTNDGGPLLVDVLNGKRLQLPMYLNASTQQVIELGGGAWQRLPSTGGGNVMSLYHLETFTEVPLVNGDGIIQTDDIAAVSMQQDGEAMALAITEEGEADSRTLTGFFIATSDGMGRFIETTEVPNPRQIALSPDGETMALTWFEGTSFTGTTSLALINTDDGSVIHSREISARDGYIDLVWSKSETALLFTNGDALYRWAPTDTEPQVLFEGEQVQGLVQTRDPQVVAVSHTETADNGPAQPKTTILNLETGEAIVLDGQDLWAGSSLSPNRTTLVLATSLPGSPRTSSEKQTVTRVAVDAVTGETLGEIDFTDADTNGFSYSSWGVDGDITVVAFSPDSMWILTDDEGNPALTRIPPPPIEGEVDEAVMLTVSPQGYLSLRTYSPSSAWIMLPGEHEWTAVGLLAPGNAAGVMPGITFIPGAD